MTNKEQPNPNANENLAILANLDFLTLLSLPDGGDFSVSEIKLALSNYDKIESTKLNPSHFFSYIIVFDKIKVFTDIEASNDFPEEHSFVLTWFLRSAVLSIETVFLIAEHNAKELTTFFNYYQKYTQDIPSSYLPSNYYNRFKKLPLSSRKMLSDYFYNVLKTHFERTPIHKIQEANLLFHYYFDTLLLFSHNSVQTITKWVALTEYLEAKYKIQLLFLFLQTSCRRTKTSLIGTSNKYQKILNFLVSTPLFVSIIYRNEISSYFPLIDFKSFIKEHPDAFF